MNLRVRWAAWLASFVLALLAGCASPPRATGPVDPVTGPWSGRLALQVQDQASQSFSASFELKGTAHSGELALFSPFGGTLALLAWQPGAATLNSNGQTRQFDTVDALVAHVIDTPVPGWQTDLSQLAQGRVAAKRLEPAPETDLRVVLEH